MQTYDTIVIGGGATGLGVAVEAASRGYNTILFEANDFGSGTSSKSTKLVHGGVRYLANFDFKLVEEGLEERSYFINNAPHIAMSKPYVVPFYSYFDKLKYLLGLKLYDLLAWNKQLAKSKIINKKELLDLLPINSDNLVGGIIYYDGIFDDTRMLITLLKTFQQFGGVAYNYTKVTNFLKDEQQKIIGVTVTDYFTKIQSTYYAKVVINATGTFTDNLLDMDEPNNSHTFVEAAQGTHLVFDHEAFPINHAFLIPKTVDNRVLFVIPWHGKIVVGTTDIEVPTPTLEPKATLKEVEFILATFNQFTKRIIDKSEIKSVFAGQRPLVKPLHAKNSAKVSRKHEILLSKNGLISIVGGKWTIYRKMAEDTINFAISKNFLPASTSCSKSLKLFGYTNCNTSSYPLNIYGSAATNITSLQKEINDHSLIHPLLPYFSAEIIYHIRYESARTIADVLMRRTRAILLNAEAAIAAAPKVGMIMAHELEKDDAWLKEQLAEFNKIAATYLINNIC